MSTDEASLLQREIEQRMREIRQRQDEIQLLQEQLVATQQKSTAASQSVQQYQQHQVVSSFGEQNPQARTTLDNAFPDESQFRSFELEEHEVSPPVRVTAQFGQQQQVVVNSPARSPPKVATTVKSPPKTKTPARQSSAVPKNNSFLIAPMVSQTISKTSPNYGIVKSALSRSPARKSASEVKTRNGPLYNTQSATQNRSHIGGKFRNPQLEAKTAELQAEFDRLMAEGIKSSPNRMNRKHGHLREDLVMNDDFYKIMGQFYQNDMQKHESPTRRLIDQKNSTFEHKAVMKNAVARTQQYGLHYTCSPGKSYRIEPDGGELPYSQAYTDPLGFYNRVMTQNVMQHKVKDLSGSPSRGTMEVSTKLTHRKVGKILLFVQNELCEFFKGNWNVTDLKAALNDTRVKETVQHHIRENNIKLVHRDSGEELYKKQLTKAWDTRQAIEEEDQEEIEPASHAQVQVDRRAQDDLNRELSAAIKRQKTNK